MTRSKGKETTIDDRLFVLPMTVWRRSEAIAIAVAAVVADCRVADG